MAQSPAFFIGSVRENFLYGPNSLDAPFQAGRPLSGGFKKLFALTRCLLRQPRYLFLDEPTTGMDSTVKFDSIEPTRRTCAG